MSNLEGKKAPPFSLSGSDGKTHSLSDYKGKIVVLYFYPKDDTPGCTKEACGFRDDFSKMAKLGAAVLGISKDSFESHKKFISKFKLPFVLLSDTDTTVSQAYGAWGEKMMYGNPVKGTIRSTVIIDGDGKVIKHWTKISNAGEHPSEVLDFLEDLKNSK